MKIGASLACLFLSGVLSAGVAGAQEPVREVIPDWPAPAFWDPSASERSFPHLRPEGLLGSSPDPSPFPFIAMTPCRVVDTRGNGFTGAYGPPAMVGGAPARTFNIPAGPCSGIPAHARAYSINVAALLPAADGFMTIFPTGEPQPTSSALNFLGGEVIANAIVAPAGTGGAISIFVNVSTHMILDINGYYAASPSPASSNVFLGPSSGNAMMTGGYNVGIGFTALRSNLSGSFNTAVGTSALASFNGDNTGSNNVALGYAALSNGAGSNNIAIGAASASNIFTGSNNILIGNSGFNNESGQIRIGTAGVQTAGTVIVGIYGFGSVGGIPVIVNSGGRLGTTTSSRRFKENIRDIAAESDGVMSLRPVAFQYKREIDPSGLAQYGLIAEEVAEIYPELVAYDADGRPEAIRYQLLDPLLLNELQKQRRSQEAQRAKIEQQSETIDDLGAEIDALKKRLVRLEARLPADVVP
jgi:hypothetical protein